MSGPVAHNLCEDLGCSHRSICLRWRAPADPHNPLSRFPVDADVDDDCPHLIDVRDLGR